MIATQAAFVDLSSYQIAQNLVERAIRALQALEESEGMLSQQDALQLRRAHVLRHALHVVSLDAVERALHDLDT